MARIQPPSDCVNALGVGACDSRSGEWKRASYSCIGPGRCPGFVKPDIVAFGGSYKEPFWVLDSTNIGTATAQQGTSFAAPNALRVGIAARAHFGPILSPLAIKALLIHRAQDRGFSREEIGWGNIPTDIAGLMICDDDAIHILYQDELKPKKWIRAPIPLPDTLEGNVTIAATICYATKTDPQDPINYTRSGIEVTFRPNDQKFKEMDQYHPNSKTLFGKGVYGATEQELRAESHKWETVMHVSKTMRSSSLSNPVLDIHYLTRAKGREVKSSDKMPFALVVTIKAPRTKDIYNKTLVRHRVLQQLRPVIKIPITV